MIDEQEPVINWHEVKIVWHSDVPNIPNYEQAIIEDCERSLWGLDRVSELIFHHIFLGPNMDNDVVIAWGEEDNEDLHCEFLPSVIWANMKHE